jgi:hypothetical protein
MFLRGKHLQAPQADSIHPFIDSKSLDKQQTQALEWRINDHARFFSQLRHRLEIDLRFPDDDELRQLAAAADDAVQKLFGHAQYLNFIAPNHGIRNVEPRKQ